jgi:hypothetical protein
MVDNSPLNGTPSAHNGLAKKIYQMFATDNERMLRRATNLLIKALCEGDPRSRSALSEFLHLPVTSTEATGAIDYDLVEQARVFINGPNAQRVQAWISSYEMSIPYSEQRLVCESILRTFVASRSAIERIKWQVSRARTLAREAQAKCDALESVIRQCTVRRRPL